MADRMLVVDGARYLLVSPRALVSSNDRAIAERIVATIWQSHDGPRVLRRALGELLGAAEGLSDAEVQRVAVAAIASGRMRMVRTQPERRRLDEPSIRPLIDPDRPVPSGPLDPPRPIEPERPPPPVEPPVVSPPEPARTFVAFELVDQDGAAVEADFVCEESGRRHEGVTDGTVVRFDDVVDGSNAEVGLDNFQLLQSPRPGPATFEPADGDVIVPVDDETAQATIPAGTTTRIVVELSKATVFTLGSYSLDHEVFVPTMLTFDEERNEGISGFGVLAQILDYARENPERTIVVVGHTDTSGSQSHNLALSRRRAEQLRSLLAADMEAWIDGCMADGEPADFGAHMRWAAQRFGVDCDPGAGEPPSADTLSSFRDHASQALGIAVSSDAPIGRDDWKSCYGLLDIALAEELDLDLAELGELRGALRFADTPTIAAGEHWPIEGAGKDGQKNATNRRTEVAFLVPEEVPTDAGGPPGAGLYAEQARIVLDYIEPEPRAVLPISLQSTDGHMVPLAGFKVVSDTGRVRFGRLDPEGHARLIDITAGDFTAYYPDHSDIEAKVWAIRLHEAIAAGDAEAVVPAVSRDVEAVHEMFEAYTNLFGANGSSDVASQARAAVAGSLHEETVDYLLALAGEVDEIDYVLHFGQQSA